MKTIALFACLFLSACGAALAEGDTVRCAHVDGGYSTVVCSCASSCALQADLSVRAEVIEECGPTSCWQDPPPARPSIPAVDAGTLLQ